MDNGNGVERGVEGVDFEVKVEEKVQVEVEEKLHVEAEEKVKDVIDVEDEKVEEKLKEVRDVEDEKVEENLKEVRDLEDEKVEEKVKDVEEEVFEEAIGVQDRLHDQETESEVGNGVVDSGLVEVDESSNMGGEVENFEEAVEVPVGEGEDKVEGLGYVDKDNGVVAPDKIDEGGTLRELVDDKLDEEMKVSEGQDVERSELSTIEAEKPENVNSAELNEEKPLVEGELESGNAYSVGEASDVGSSDKAIEIEIEKPENGISVDANEEKPRVESELQNGHAGMVEEGRDYSSNMEVVQESELGGEYQNEKAEAVDLVDASAEIPMELSGEKEKDSVVNVESGKVDDMAEELREDPQSVDLDNGDRAIEEGSNSLVEMKMGRQDDQNGEAKVTLPDLVSESSKEIHGPKSTFDEFTDAVVERIVTQEIESLASLEKPTNEKKGSVEIGTADLKSEPQLAEEIVREIHVVAIKPEKKEEKEPQEKHTSQAVSEEPQKNEEGEEKQNTQVIRERKVQPPVGLASLAAKTENPCPPARPAGLGRAAPLLEPAPRAVQHQRANGAVSHSQSQQIEESGNGETDEYDETREKLQMIRVKFLRLAHRLGQTPHNVVVAQVLYRLGLAEQLRGGTGGRVGAFSFDRASAMAEQLEAAGQEPLDFSCTIMVLGKTGVGKSATINSIFDEVKFGTDAFQMGTKKVQDVVGTVQGIKVRVIDTPGLLPSGTDQRQNEKILHSVKRFIKKTSPDIVLYLDRLDMQSRDFNDMPLLRTITDIFGPSIWFNAIVVLTHAASAPPDGPNGTASGYDMFVTQRSQVVQHAIRQAAGDMRLMNPVSLVENHSACRTNRAGQRVLPNGQVWKPHLLLLSFASKILAEANTLLKLQDSPPGKPFATRSRAPPLPFLLSSLLQSRPQVKLPEEQYGDEDEIEDDLNDSSESEDEVDYDDLPPFKPLTKAQLAKLTRAQKKAYMDEYIYRENLLMKRQLKEERRQRRMMKKMAAEAKDLPAEESENVEEDGSGQPTVPVSIPDLALPASFDSDNPTHRYRYVDSNNQWLVRPVLDTHGWDHDVGYEGINAERVFVVKEKVPISFSGQISKDKKDANLQMELASSVKHGEGKATSLGLDMQTVGKDLAYTLRSETRFSNYRRNKATAGISVTHLGDSLSAGVKIEDKLIVSKRLRVVMTGGAMTGRGDIAYGGSLEAQLKDKDYPIGRWLSTLGLSIMDWHGDCAIGCNIQSQIPIGHSSNLIARANVNNRGAGQVSVRVNSSEHIQLALVALVPLLKKLFVLPQQMQFGQ